MMSARFFGFQNYVLVGAVIYLAISFCLMFGVPYHHRKGIALLKKGAFIEAIPFFEKSYGFSKETIGWINTDISFCCHRGDQATLKWRC